MTTKQREYRYETTITMTCVAYDEDEAFNMMADAIDRFCAQADDRTGWVGLAVPGTGAMEVRKADDQDFEYDERDA